MANDVHLPGNKRLPYCDYPCASDTDRHGLQPLPDVLPIVDLDSAHPYRSSKLKIVKVDSLGTEKLLEMIRVMARSFAVNDPTLRQLNLPKDFPADIQGIKHKDLLGVDYFGDWSKENLIFWSTRLFYVTDPCSPLEAIENNMDTLKKSLAVLNEAGQVIGGVLTSKINLSKAGTPPGDNDAFIQAITPFFEPVSQLLRSQLNFSINTICKKYPAFLTALKEGRVADIDMIARSPLLPPEETFELMAATVENLQQSGFQYLVVLAGNQWTGAAMDLMKGVKVHFAPYRDIKRVYESDEPVADKPSSKDGYISDKDSGSMFYILRLN
jgi:hypothetical protein